MHIHCAHQASLEENGVTQHFNTSLKRFALFTLHWRLVDPTQFEACEELINALTAGALARARVK